MNARGRTVEQGRSREVRDPAGEHRTRRAKRANPVADRAVLVGRLVAGDELMIGLGVLLVGAP